MTAAPASMSNAGEIAALADPLQTRVDERPHEAILVLRGVLIALALFALAALLGVALASLIFGYPIGRLA